MRQESPGPTVEAVCDRPSTDAHRAPLQASEQTDNFLKRAAKIKTFEEAFRFVQKVKICTIFASEKIEHPSLWENVDLPDKKPGEKGWGKKVEAVWNWKNRLPAEFPEEIFYGKIKGGFAVLMEMDYLRKEHFAKAYSPVKNLKPLAGFIYEQIRIEPWGTTSLRKLTMEEKGCSKSQFDTALKSLQISMNIVRSNNPNIEQDTWLTFKEVHPDIWEEVSQVVRSVP